MKENIVEYIMRNWTDLLSTVIAVFICYKVTILFWSLFRPSRLFFNDFEIKVNDMVTLKSYAECLITGDIDNPSISRMWYVINIEDGVLTLSNAQFSSVTKLTIKDRVTIVDRK